MGLPGSWPTRRTKRYRGQLVARRDDRGGGVRVGVGRHGLVAGGGAPQPLGLAAVRQAPAGERLPVGLAAVPFRQPGDRAPEVEEAFVAQVGEVAHDSGEGVLEGAVVVRAQDGLGLHDPRDPQPFELQQPQDRVGGRDDHDPRQHGAVHQADGVPQRHVVLRVDAEDVEDVARGARGLGRPGQDALRRPVVDVEHERTDPVRLLRGEGLRDVVDLVVQGLHRLLHPLAVAGSQGIALEVAGHRLVAHARRLRDGVDRGGSAGRAALRSGGLDRHARRHLLTGARSPPGTLAVTHGLRPPGRRARTRGQRGTPGG